MKQVALIVCLFLLLIPAGVSANGYINITTIPSNALINLDAVYEGPAPLNLSATSGTHTLSLSLNGYSPYSISVNIPENSTIPFSYTFTNPAPALSAISPTSGINTSTLNSVTISGTNFFTGSGFIANGGSVVLRRSGHTNITATGVSVISATQITCSLPITSADSGTWDVILTNPDGQSATLSNAFTIKSQASAPTVTSIDPTSGTANATVTINSLVGTNFISGTSTIKLVNGYYSDIPGNVTSVNAAGTIIQGTFDLSGQEPGAYQVCVYNSASIYGCGSSFTVGDSGATNNSVYFESNPEGAAVFLGNSKIGTTPFTYYNISTGTFSVHLQLSGYNDYTDSVTVVRGKRVSFYANMVPVGQTATVTTTTTARTTPVTTATTIRKSTLKIPTTYAEVPTTAADSPVDPLIVIGAAGLALGLVVLRRR